jgi:hypothetical protein
VCVRSVACESRCVATVFGAGVWRFLVGLLFLVLLQVSVSVYLSGFRRFVVRSFGGTCGEAVCGRGLLCFGAGFRLRRDL